MNLLPRSSSFVVFVCWALFHVFGARAAYVHAGVMIGTIMVANVFFVIARSEEDGRRHPRGARA